MKAAFITTGRKIPIFCTIGADIPTYQQHEKGIMFNINKSMTDDDLLNLVLAAFDEYYPEEKYITVFWLAIEIVTYLSDQIYK